MNKRFEAAFKLFADYNSDEYRKLNGTHKKFSLLVLNYRYRKSAITLIGTWHIEKTKGAKQEMIKGIKSQVLNYFMKTPRNKRILMVERSRYGSPFCGDTLEKSFDMGEPSGVTFLAKEKGAKVISPEPAMENQIKELSALGFTKYQIMLYYVVRELPSEIETQAVNDYEIMNIQRLAVLLGDRKAKKFEEDYIFNTIIPKLNAEMSKLKGKPLFKRRGNLIFSNYDSDELYPLTDPTLPAIHPEKAILTNEIAFNVSYIRDKNIIREIDKAIKSGKSPLAVYGRSHVARIKPALDYLYGKPIRVMV
jgi:hypothetical protein